jgi:hypothetical protein
MSARRKRDPSALRQALTFTPAEVWDLLWAIADRLDRQEDATLYRAERPGGTYTVDECAEHAARSRALLAYLAANRNIPLGEVWSGRGRGERQLIRAFAWLRLAIEKSWRGRCACGCGTYRVLDDGLLSCEGCGRVYDGVEVRP